MNLFSRLIAAALLLLQITGCSRPKADLLFYNGTIYTLDDSFRTVSAMAIRDGKVLAVGPGDVLLDYYAAAEVIDLKGRSVYPGFIDAHSHFFGYASDLLKLDLTGTTSFQAIIDSVQRFSERNRFEWILGRGWDQNDWTDKSYPDRAELDRLFPDQPVFLMRIDGHAALCNGAALKRASIDGSTVTAGGEVVMKNGVPTGLLIDNAVELVSNSIPPFPEALNEDALLAAQANCFRVGLTTVSDAGLGIDSVRLLQRMQESGRLKLRINVMLSDRPYTLEPFLRSGPVISDRLTARAIKVYADGALGSRGALLKQPYSDQPGHYGFLLHDRQRLDAINEVAYRYGFQVCTHAIGDSAVALVLEGYGKRLKGKNDCRWRIEHCQVIDPSDLPAFSDYSVIPSVQPTHATSDMYWAESRLGKDRLAHGYAYRKLLDAAGTIAYGTDFPVEKIDPLLTFFASVSRKDLDGFPSGGFLPKDGLDRKSTLKAMTTGAAYASFEESVKGSLTAGKYADFVLLDRDILTVAESELPATKVIATYLAGERVY